MKKVITIAGGGIAGLTAAINLRKAGIPVRVFEKRPEIGARFNGDYQCIENWLTDEDCLDFLRRVGVEPTFPFRPERSVTAYDAAGREYRYGSAATVGYIVRRGSMDDCLDQHLKRQAIALGAEVILGEACPPKDADIIATGPGRPFILLQGMAFRTRLDDEIRVIFSQRLAPGFYAYLIAENGNGYICTARARPKKGKRRLLEETAAKFHEHLDFGMEAPKRFANYGVSRPIWNHRKIIVGEAAGFQDALWGFGMRYAFLSGHLAAMAVAEGRDYWDMARMQIAPSVRASIVNRLLTDITGDAGYWTLLHVMRWYGDLRLFLRYHYRPRLWKLALYPLAAAHLLPLFGHR
ncbi:MAG: NAD(P)/FAD-dependent oxidoreductase [Planctomycetota bacterium]